MPSGDAQRAWFPEMIEELKSAWSSSMTWEELAVFCHRMTEKRKQIRLSRGIKSPIITCKKCGKMSRADPLPVSIRSALFALRNAGVLSESEFKELDKDWKKFKKRNSLDSYGKKSET